MPIIVNLDVMMAKRHMGAGWSLHTDDLGFWQVVAWHCTAIYLLCAGPQ